MGIAISSNPLTSPKPGGDHWLPRLRQLRGVAPKGELSCQLKPTSNYAQEVGHLFTLRASLISHTTIKNQPSVPNLD